MSAISYRRETDVFVIANELPKNLFFFVVPFFKYHNNRTNSFKQNGFLFLNFKYTALKKIQTKPRFIRKEARKEMTKISGHSINAQNDEESHTRLHDGRRPH